MGKFNKLLLKIIRAESDSNIHFSELCLLLKKLGFSERIKGSHHNFYKTGIMEKINLQKDGNKAKSYQVRQVRNILTKYHLTGEINE